MEEKDYWEKKINLDRLYYEGKLALEKEVAKATIAGITDGDLRDKLLQDVDKIFLNHIPG